MKPGWFRAHLEKIKESAARKSKRKEKAWMLWREKPIGKRPINRAAIKRDIVRMLGLLDRYRHGPLCRIHGNHPGELGYHIIPQQRGDAARFIPENVVWACAAANYGEVMNRSLYREKHIAIFGRDRVERIEKTAKGTMRYSDADLLEIRRAAKAAVEAASCWSVFQTNESRDRMLLTINVLEAAVRMDLQKCLT